VERAKTLLLGASMLSARDAIHVAVMERHQAERILSFDAGYDRVPGLIRVHEG
jgi:predicted nucleic acid-binding protein